jgi:phage shock protein E
MHAASADPASEAAPSKDPAAARRALAAGGAIVLDVRTSEEFADDHLEGAVNVPVQELSSRLPDVAQLAAGDRATPIVLYCGSGERAGKAKRVLDAEGYTQVINGGGLDDLRLAGAEPRE